MKRTVNIHEAKTHLSRLIEEVVATGEEVVIAKAGKPMAVLSVHRDAKPERRVLGILRGKVALPENIDARNDEVESMFEGRD